MVLLELRGDAVARYLVVTGGDAEIVDGVVVSGCVGWHGAICPAITETYSGPGAGLRDGWRDRPESPEADGPSGCSTVRSQLPALVQSELPAIVCLGCCNSTSAFPTTNEASTCRVGSFRGWTGTRTSSPSSQPGSASRRTAGAPPAPEGAGCRRGSSSAGRTTWTRSKTSGTSLSVAIPTPTSPGRSAPDWSGAIDRWPTRVRTSYWRWPTGATTRRTWPGRPIVRPLAVRQWSRATGSITPVARYLCAQSSNGPDRLGA